MSNPLYHFLASQKEDVKFQHAKKITQLKNYFMLELPVPAYTLSDAKTRITTKECHLSVYEKGVEYKGRKSRIFGYNHCTIKCTIGENPDPESEKTPPGKQCVIHVYFNEKDEQVCLPFFVNNNKEDPLPEVSEELKGDLLDFANFCSEELLRELRREQQSKILTLEKEYKTLDREASTLSAELKKNGKLKQEYEKKLHESIERAQQLEKLTNNTYYQGAQRFLRALIDSLHLTPQTQAAAVITPNEKPATVATKPAANAPNNRQRRKGKRPQKQKPKQLSTADRIMQLNTPITKLKQLGLGAEKIAQFQNLSFTITDLNLLIEQEPLPTARLQQLKNYQEELATIGEHIFLGLIQPEKNQPLQTRNIDTTAKKEATSTVINQAITPGTTKEIPGERTLQLQQAAAIPGLHYLINTEHLAYALKNADAALLEFLLQHGNFAINYHPLTIDGVNYDNAMAYCYKFAHKEHMSSCFCALLRANAATTIADEQGIPLAHRILTTQDHVFKQPLLDHLLKNESLHVFYRKLHYGLKRYLATHETKQPEELERYSAQYKINAELCQIPLNISNSFRRSAFLKTITALTPMLEIVFVDKVTTDCINQTNRIIHNLLTATNAYNHDHLYRQGLEALNLHIEKLLQCCELQLTTFKNFKITDIDKGCSLHLISKLPEELMPPPPLPQTLLEYKDSYLFIKKDDVKELYYIDLNGIPEKAEIVDFNLFEQKINAIKNKDTTALYLNKEQIEDIITSNGDHTRDKRQEALDNIQTLLDSFNTYITSHATPQGAKHLGGIPCTKVVKTINEFKDYNRQRKKLTTIIKDVTSNNAATQEQLDDLQLIAEQQHPELALSKSNEKFASKPTLKDLNYFTHTYKGFFNTEKPSKSTSVDNSASSAKTLT